MKQSEALDILKSGKNVFLTGSPGAGKTYTINLYKDYLREKYETPAITASTGIAATHIGGITIHSFAGIGIKNVITDSDIENIMEKEYVVRRILGAHTLVIDEISMLDANTLDNVDRVIRHVRGTAISGIPFGGMQVVFVGDFFQLPPVSPDGDVIFAYESKAWKEANPTICYITEQHRQEDPRFLEILTAMRDGVMTKPHIDSLLTSKDSKKKSTELYTHNIDVDRINEASLAKIDMPIETYRMTKTGIPYLADLIAKHCLSPELLRLKVGAIVMFTRNNFDEGYVNGTLGIVTEFTPGKLPIVKTKDGSSIVVKEAEWSMENGQAAIQQIPLRLAWAITVHKSQGMSLDEATMDLSKCFEYGQGYVALSRVRSIAGLHLTGLNKKALEMHPDIVVQDKIFRELSGKTME